MVAGMDDRQKGKSSIRRSYLSTDSWCPKQHTSLYRNSTIIFFNKKEGIHTLHLSAIIKFPDGQFLTKGRFRGMSHLSHFIIEEKLLRSKSPG